MDELLRRAWAVGVREVTISKEEEVGYVVSAELSGVDTAARRDSEAEALRAVLNSLV